MAILSAKEIYRSPLSEASYSSGKRYLLSGIVRRWPARLDVVGEPACIIQIRLTKQIRRNKRKIEASSRGQGRQEFALYRRARGYGRNTSCKRRLAVPAFAREACAKRGKILAANIPPRCCCLCEGSLRQARGNTCCKHPA